jgi:mannose-6-phosphate isomerase
MRNSGPDVEGAPNPGGGAGSRDRPGAGGGDTGDGGAIPRGTPGPNMALPESRLPPRGRESLAPSFHPTRVEKPWGYELIWARSELYVGKILHIHAGEAFSLQFHEEKDETLYLLRGRVRLQVGPGVDSMEERIMEEGESVRIEPGILHRMEALTEVDLLEASTPELDDVVRVQDRYGRGRPG